MISLLEYSFFFYSKLHHLVLSHFRFFYLKLHILFSRIFFSNTLWLHYAGVTLSRFWLPMDTRWRKFATSGMIVNTSGHSGMHPKPSCVRRLSFLGFGGSFGSVHKIFGMSKNCRRSSRSCTIAWTSCVLLVHRVAIVRPSCVHPVGSCGHRLYFVWPSATPGIFSTRWQTMGTRSLPMVSGRLHVVARPSNSHRVTHCDTFIVSRWDHDVIKEAVYKNINLKSNILEQCLSSMKLQGKRNRPHC